MPFSPRYLQFHHLLGAEAFATDGVRLHAVAVSLTLSCTVKLGPILPLTEELVTLTQ